MIEFIDSFLSKDIQILLLAGFMSLVVIATLSLQIYRMFAILNLKRKSKLQSADVITYQVTPNIISIISPTFSKHNNHGYRRTIEFNDSENERREFEFEFEEDILPQSLIDEYRNFKKSQGSFIDGLTTDFADSSSVEDKRLKLVQGWIESNLSEEIIVNQDKNNKDIIEIEDPLEQFVGKSNNDLEEVEYKESPNGGRYMLLFIIVVFGGLVWYGRHLQHG